MAGSLPVFNPAHEIRFAAAGSQFHCLSSRNSWPMKICGMPGAVSSIPVAKRERLCAYHGAVIGAVREGGNAQVCAHFNDVVIFDARHGLPAVSEAWADRGPPAIASKSTGRSAQRS